MSEPMRQNIEHIVKKQIIEKTDNESKITETHVQEWNDNLTKYIEDITQEINNTAEANPDNKNIQKLAKTFTAKLENIKKSLKYQAGLEEKVYENMAIKYLTDIHKLVASYHQKMESHREKTSYTRPTGPKNSPTGRTFMHGQYQRPPTIATKVKGKGIKIGLPGITLKHGKPKERAKNSPTGRTFMIGQSQPPQSQITKPANKAPRIKLPGITWKPRKPEGRT